MKPPDAAWQKFVIALDNSYFAPMVMGLKELLARIAQACDQKSFGILLIIDSLIALLLTVIFADSQPAGVRFVIFFICSQAIGTSIFLLVSLSGVLALTSFWKRAAWLTGIFVASAWLGALLTLGLLMLFAQGLLSARIIFSWLLRSTFFAVLFGAVVTSYFVLRQRLQDHAARLAEKEINEQRLLQLKSKAELEALRAKINPHFLFNALNSIASLIPVAPARAEEMVQRLAHLFRYTLQATQSGTVKLSEELALVREYLEIEKVRLGERLFYEISSEDEVSSTLLPALLLQPLVENSVLHGISPSKEGGRISIQCRRENSYCRIEIRDTGRGFTQPEAGEGFGLHSVRERLALQYGEHHTFQLSSQEGVHITIQLPLSEKSTSNHAI